MFMITFDYCQYQNSHFEYCFVDINESKIINHNIKSKDKLILYMFVYANNSCICYELSYSVYANCLYFVCSNFLE